MRAIELGDRARLPLEAGPNLGRGRQVRGQHLNGNVTPQARITGAIDLPHAAHADSLDDSVVGEDLVD